MKEELGNVYQFILDCDKIALMTPEQAEAFFNAWHYVIAGFEEYYNQLRKGDENLEACWAAEAAKQDMQAAIYKALAESNYDNASIYESVALRTAEGFN